MKTRHVLIRGSLEDPVPGFVLDWRLRPGRGATPPLWEAFVAMKVQEPIRFEWIASMYLTPVYPPGI